MQISQIVTDDTLLSYQLLTSPLPLQVSPQSGPPSIGTLTFVISCPVSVGEVTVSQITFNLPVGDPKNPDASDLTETSGGISPSVSSSGTDQWVIGAGTVAGSFVLKPAPNNPGTIDQQGLSVVITGIQVSPIVGTALVNIVELATSDNTAPQSRTCTFEVPKFPYGFYAGDFAASEYTIQDGDTATLFWSGSVGPMYQILQYGYKPKDVTNLRVWTSDPLTTTTAFILQVTAQEAGQTVNLYFSITVIVANPDITATTLDVSKTSALRGNVSVGTTSTPANLTISGNTTANSVLASTLSVNGAATVSSLATGPLNASGASNLSGSTAISGALTASGAVSLFGASRVIQPGSYVQSTDGILIGTVSPSGSAASFDATIVGWTDGITVQATGGGTLKAVNPPSYYAATTSGTFILPTRKGKGFSVSIVPPWFSMQMPICMFYWIPLGSPTSSLQASKPAAGRVKKAAKSKAAPSLPVSRRWFSGSAKLVKGRAAVRLADIAEARRLVKEKKSYVVQLTPLGECNGLAIAAKLPNRFNVIELGSGRSNIKFDWTISFSP